MLGFTFYSSIIILFKQFLTNSNTSSTCIMTSYRGTGRSWRGRFPGWGRKAWILPGGPGWQGSTRSLPVGMYIYILIIKNNNNNINY